MLVFGSTISSSFLAALLALPVLVAIIFILQKEIKCSQKVNYDIIWYTIFIVSAVLLVIAAYSLRPHFSWDWGVVIESAAEKVLTGTVTEKFYFARYPNNQFWYMLMVLFFQGVKLCNPSAESEQFYDASVALSCAFVLLTIFMIHRIARILWGSKQALVSGIMTVLFLPMYLYAAFAYTDTSGMLVLVMLIYFFVKMWHNEGSKISFCLYLIAVGIMMAIAWHLKVTIFILCIAMVLAALLYLKNWKKAGIAVVLVSVSFGIGNGGIQKAVPHFISFTEEEADAVEFPLTHWVMMALDYGGYVTEDVEYTMSFPDYESKKEANIKEIKARVQEKGLGGMVEHIGYTKLKRTWEDPTFAGSAYVSRYPVNPDGFLQRFVINTGDLYWIFVLYTSVYYIILLLGIVLSGVLNYREKPEKQPLLFLRIGMIGMVLFLSIWECNSRYIVAYFPMLLLLASEGLYLCRRVPFLTRIKRL